MMNQQLRMALTKIGYAWPHVNAGADGKMVKEKKKEKYKSIDLMEDSEEAAIRSCHQEPTRRNIVIVIACIKTLQLESFTMLTSCICIFIFRQTSRI